MPDHLHFLAEGTEPTSDLLHFVKSLKMKSSRQHSAHFGRALWQREFYEHIMGPRESVEAVAWYIWLNPVRKKLVAKPEHYSFSGTLTGWKMPRVWTTPDWRPPWKLAR
jgi:REP element-mobilizing transposase RayT